MDKDWKLKLRYGKLSTPFTHYSVVSDVMANDLDVAFDCPNGPARLGMKAWASDDEEVMDMLVYIGSREGYTVEGETFLYKTPPEQPPRDEPFAYDIKLTPYQD